MVKPIGDHVLEGNALAAIAEVLIGSAQGTAIVLGQFFVFLVIDHDFQQRANRAEFGGRQQVEQRVSLLAFLLEIECRLGLLPFAAVADGLPAGCVLQDQAFQ